MRLLQMNDTLFPAAKRENTENDRLLSKKLILCIVYKIFPIMTQGINALMLIRVKDAQREIG